MIIKGTSRAGPKQLAWHLLRRDTNERVEILELQSPCPTLRETFRDWQVLAGGTNGVNGLYHANIDPDARYDMTEDQWRRAADVLEEKLGFQGQPRAIVLHEKENGRQHIHVVWQRTDVDTMTLRSDSWNYLAHEKASLALEDEFGHEHVPGKHAKRDREKQPDFPRSEMTHAEWQQAQRSGLDPRARKDAITALYEQSDTPAAFKAALEENGYILAKGDRRDFVIVDEAGDIHSLGRQIKDAKAADLRAFMADLGPEALPSADQAKELQQELRKTREQARKDAEEEQPADKEQKPERKPTAKTPEQEAFEKTLADRQEQEDKKLRAGQVRDLRNLKDALGLERLEKLRSLEERHKAEQDRLARALAKKREGVVNALTEFLNPALKKKRDTENKKALKDLATRQKQQRDEIDKRLKQEHAAEINARKEQHEQQRREQAQNFKDEKERYARDQKEARRLLREIEKQRLKEEIERQKRDKDGPDWPRPPTR